MGRGNFWKSPLLEAVTAWKLWAEKNQGIGRDMDSLVLFLTQIAKSATRHKCGVVLRIMLLVTKFRITKINISYEQ
jgi:hypothetical protein